MSNTLRTAIDNASAHPGQPGATSLEIMRERRSMLHAGMTGVLDDLQAERRDMQATI